MLPVGEQIKGVVFRCELCGTERVSETAFPEFDPIQIVGPPWSPFRIGARTLSTQLIESRISIPPKLSKYLVLLLNFAIFFDLNAK